MDFKLSLSRNSHVEKIIRFLVLEPDYCTHMDNFMVLFEKKKKCLQASVLHDSTGRSNLQNFSLCAHN